MKINSLILTALLLLPTFAISSDLITPSEKQVLAKGKMVKKIVWKDGYVWPEVTAMIVLDHDPLENLNVFLDFDKHKTYIPEILESKIVKKISENQMHVYFEMKVPWPVSKSVYTTNNVITKDPDGSHTLKWNLVNGSLIKSSDGHMTFSPYEGKTLITYVTFIVPNSSLAGMFKNRVAVDVEVAFKKITKHLTKTLNKKSKLTSTNQQTSTQNN
jgi:hypothetical protein